MLRHVTPSLSRDETPEKQNNNKMALLLAVAMSTRLSPLITFDL